MPHGFAFVVKRLFNNQPRPILPVFQNTCYPPNQPSAKRSYQLGQQIAEAANWARDLVNEPANVVHTAKALAVERRVPFDEFEAGVAASAAAVFGW